MINKQEFQSYVDQGYNMIPVSKNISLEQATPLNLYSKISNKTIFDVWSTLLAFEKLILLAIIFLLWLKLISEELKILLSYQPSYLVFYSWSLQYLIFDIFFLPTPT